MDVYDFSIKNLYYFENKSTADVPAQEVAVDLALNGKLLDLKSLEFGDVVFGNQTVDAMAGKRGKASFCVAQKGSSYQVKGEASCDAATGAVRWYLRSYDASQAENGYWPEAVDAGFLPPNDADGNGEGHVTFSVKVRGDAPVGSRIDCSASIVFDQNPAIVTSPAWFNWVYDGVKSPMATGMLTWDAVDGAEYDVTIWTGDPDSDSEAAVAVVSSGALKTNQWRLPDGLEEGKTYFWRVKTTGRDGIVSNSAVWAFETSGRQTYRLQPGWNLLSLPFVPDELSVKAILAYKPYAIENGLYLQPDTVAMNKGYWLYGTADAYLDIFPLVATRSAVAIELQSGWNFIGPTESDRWVDASSTVWTFENGRFVNVKTDAGGKGYTLLKGQGYWIYQP